MFPFCLTFSKALSFRPSAFVRTAFCCISQSRCHFATIDLTRLHRDHDLFLLQIAIQVSFVRGRHHGSHLLEPWRCFFGTSQMGALHGHHQILLLACSCELEGRKNFVAHRNPGVIKLRAISALILRFSFSDFI